MPKYLDKKQINLMREVLSDLLVNPPMVPKIINIISSNKAYSDIDQIPALILSKPKGTFAENLTGTPFMNELIEEAASYDRVYLYSAIVFAYNYVLDCLKPDRSTYFDSYLLRTIKTFGCNHLLEDATKTQTWADSFPNWVLLPFYKDSFILNSFIKEFSLRFAPIIKKQDESAKRLCAQYPKELVEGAEMILKDAILSDHKSFRKNRLDNNDVFNNLKKLPVVFEKVSFAGLEHTLDTILVTTLFCPLFYTALLSDFQARLFDGKILLKNAKQGGRTIFHTETQEISNLLKFDDTLKKNRWFISITVTKVTNIRKSNTDTGFRFLKIKPEKIEGKIQKKSIKSTFSRKKYRIFNQAVEAPPLLDEIKIEISSEYIPAEIEISIHKAESSESQMMTGSDGLTVKLPYSHFMYLLRNKAPERSDEKTEAITVTDNERWNYFFNDCNKEIPELRNSQEGRDSFKDAIMDQFDWDDISSDFDDVANNSGLIDILKDTFPEIIFSTDYVTKVFEIFMKAHAAAIIDNNFRPVTPNRLGPNIADMPAGMVPTLSTFLTLRKDYKSLTSLMQNFHGNSARDKSLDKELDGKDDHKKEPEPSLDRTYASQCLEALMLYLVNYADVSFTDKIYMIMILEKIKKNYQ